MSRKEFDPPTGHQFNIERKIMFKLSEDQIKKINDWMEAHDKEKHIPVGKTFRYSGAIGGAYTWEFTPTSLGVVQKVRCSCDEHVDVTDYDAW